MTVQQAIDIIRARTNDVDAQIFTDNELIHYVNMGISTVANQMIAAMNPYTVKSVLIPTTAGVAIPDDFHSMMPGELCYIVNGNVFLEDALTPPRAVRYFSAPATIDDVGDTIPLPSPYTAAVVNVAVELAAMRIGKDVNQERQGHMVMSNMRAAFQTPLGFMGIAPQSGGGPSADKGQS